MPTYALTGNDTFVLNNRVYKDFADGSTITIDFPNERTGKTTGKNGNTIYSTNTQGRNATVELRLIAASADDVFTNGLSVQQERDLPTFTLLNGRFAKRVGDGQGNVKFINYILSGGVIDNNVNTNENLQGETEQGLAVYRIFFAEAQRAIG